VNATGRIAGAELQPVELLAVVRRAQVRPAVVLQLHRVPGADHVFTGREDALVAACADWLERLGP